MSALLLADVDTVLADLEAEFDAQITMGTASDVEDTNTCGTCTCPCGPIES